MEIRDLHREKADYRFEDFSYASIERGKILRVGLERSALDRAYCAFFTPDGTITYEGKGKGLKGFARGKVDSGYLSAVMMFLGSLDLEALPDGYMMSGISPFQWGFELFDFYLLMETKESTKILNFRDGLTPPQFNLALAMLDSLLDSAAWNKPGFFIQRIYAEKPLRKRKWG